MEILGIDCWRVLFHPLTGEWIPGARESLQRIVRSGKYKEIHVISKVPHLLQPITRLNFYLKGFFKKTGIPKTNLHFCVGYAQKAEIARELGVTRFIDDRLEVLKDMNFMLARYAFHPNSRERAAYPDVEKSTTTVHSWAEVEKLLLE